MIGGLTMAAVDTRPEIRNFLAGSFPSLTIGDEDDIFDLGIVSSLFAIQLVMFIEKNFELTIPNEELEFKNFRTVSSLSQLVERLTETHEDA
jgi:methoxymalonate biosynthesis acyl carrier protein